MGRKVVSLDLGSSGIRAVEMTLGKTNTLEKVAFARLDRGVVEAGEIKDPAAVTEALKALWAEAKFATKNVAFGVANNNVVVRQMDLNWLEPAEFRKALPFEVADVLSVNMEDMTLDYHVLSEFDEPGEAGQEPQRKVRILLVLATSAMVSGFASAILDAGLLPVRADLNPFALIRSGTTPTTEPGVAEAVIDIGADVTNIVVHQDGQPRFVRIIVGQGGNAVTDALAARFGWSVEDSERSKIALGLSTQVAPSGTGETVFGGTAPAAAAPAEHPAQAIINNLMSGYISEIRQSLEFFLTSSDSVTSFSRVLLSGGGSLMNGLAPRLSSELRLPVDYAAPFTGLTVPDKVATSLPEGVIEQQLSAAVGLALGAS